MFPMWDMRQRARIRGREESGVAAACWRGPGEEGSYHSWDEEGGGWNRSLCKSPNRPEKLQGAVEENGRCKAVALRGDIRVGAFKSGREEGRWKETEDGD